MTTSTSICNPPADETPHVSTIGSSDVTDIPAAGIESVADVDDGLAGEDGGAEEEVIAAGDNGLGGDVGAAEGLVPIAEGEGLLELIPQRPPIVMVDALYRADEASAETGLGVAAENIFVEGGCLRESGIIEHVAQSAAAFNGYWSVVRGIKPSLGYIAEIKKFKIESLPPVGAHLRTTLTVHNSFGGMMLLSAEVRCDSRDGHDGREAPFDSRDGSAKVRFDSLAGCGEVGAADSPAQNCGRLVAHGQMKLFMDSKE